MACLFILFSLPSINIGSCIQTGFRLRQFCSSCSTCEVCVAPHAAPTIGYLPCLFIVQSAIKHNSSTQLVVLFTLPRKQPRHLLRCFSDTQDRLSSQWLQSPHESTCSTTVYSFFLASKTQARH